MLKTSFILATKKQLTHDVYELTYSCDELSKEIPKPWQYVMFQLAPGLNRAYSLASFSDTTFTLIIKRIPDGRGSPLICDADIGTILAGMIPLGHFTLMDTPRSKCFIGTGTGFAPLYCQMLAASLQEKKPEKIAFIFGVRSFEDSFYEDEIRWIGEDFSDFSYKQYFSRETTFTEENQNQGYVTDSITSAFVTGYEEYYICGSPAMVKSAREKLEALGIIKESIFWEQF